jgi:hypothetical protein
MAARRRDDPDAAAAPDAAIQPGDAIYINGETDVAELYAPPDDGAVTLAAAFGNSHVVGGSYHPGRGTFCVVQDRAAPTQHDRRDRCRDRGGRAELLHRRLRRELR